jgi:PBP1b-binding outer membrane lipoprotein LpoB
VLDKAAQHPAVIAIGRIINNTTLYIDTDLLMKKIRVRLNNSGKAITDTTGGALNNVDFTFSGKIIQPDNARAGNKTQRTYVFQLSLTDSRGLALWEEEKEVIKITKRGGLGL